MIALARCHPAVLFPNFDWSPSTTRRISEFLRRNYRTRV